MGGARRRDPKRRCPQQHAQHRQCRGRPGVEVLCRGAKGGQESAGRQRRLPRPVQSPPRRRAGSATPRPGCRLGDVEGKLPHPQRRPRPANGTGGGRRVRRLARRSGLVFGPPHAVHGAVRGRDPRAILPGRGAGDHHGDAAPPGGADSHRKRPHSARLRGGGVQCVRGKLHDGREQTGGLRQGAQRRRLCGGLAARVGDPLQRHRGSPVGASTRRLEAPEGRHRYDSEGGEPPRRRPPRRRPP